MLVASYFVIALANSGAEARSNFVERHLKVQLLDQKEKVRKLLGPPDFVLGEEDSSVWADGFGLETWIYGARGRDDVPTRARLVFTRRGELIDGDRMWLSPLAPSVPESTIQKGMRAWAKFGLVFMGDPLTEVPRPIAAIRIANELLPLRKDGILASLQEYVAVHWSQSTELMAEHESVLRLLFTVDQAAVASDQSEEMKQAVRWSTATFVFQDIPVVGHRIGGFTGVPPSISGVIPMYRKFGTLRTSPVTPAPNPLVWQRELQISTAWGEARQVLRDSRGVQIFVRDLLTSIVPKPYTERQEDQSWEEAWNGFLAQLPSREITWEATKQVYRPKGSGHFDPLPFWDSTARVFIPKALKASGVRFVLRRFSPNGVSITYRTLDKNVSDLDGTISVAGNVPTKLIKIEGNSFSSSGGFMGDSESSLAFLKITAPVSTVFRIKLKGRAGEFDSGAFTLPQQKEK